MPLPPAKDTYAKAKDLGPWAFALYSLVVFKQSDSSDLEIVRIIISSLWPSRMIETFPANLKNVFNLPIMEPHPRRTPQSKYKINENNTRIEASEMHRETHRSINVLAPQNFPAYYMVDDLL